MRNKVKCIGLSEDMSTITQIYIHRSSDKNQVNDEAQNVLRNLENVLLHNYDRKNIDGELGLWCCTKENGTAYYALVDHSFPDRLTYKMLKELSQIYHDFDENQNLDQLNKNSNSLLDKYNNPQQFDKLTQANQGLGEVRQEVQKNIDQLITGQEDISDLEEQTKRMKHTALGFEKSSKTLEREMFWRKMKYTFYIVLLIIIIIVIIVIMVKLL